MASHHQRSHDMPRVAYGKYLLYEGTMPIMGPPPSRGDDIEKIVDRVVQDETSDSDSDVESEIHHCVYTIRLDKVIEWEAHFVVDGVRCQLWEGVYVSNSRVYIVTLDAGFKVQDLDQNACATAIAKCRLRYSSGNDEGVYLPTERATARSQTPSRSPSPSLLVSPRSTWTMRKSVSSTRSSTSSRNNLRSFVC